MKRSWAANSWIIALAAIALATALRPGDASFIFDEPALLHMALALNHTPGVFWGIHLPFTVCVYCQLTPTHGLFYGPAPVWVYQVLLAITYDPIKLVVMHSLFLSSLTAVALAWLAKSLRVSPWLAVVTMLSPWLWIYHRMLWDNNLCIPLSAMMLAGYADFVARRRGWSLFVSAFCAAMLPLVHLMAFAIVVPLAVAAFVFQFGTMLKRKWSLLGGLVAVNVFGWPYWKYAATFYRPMKPTANLSAWRGWVYPLLGAHHISAAGLGSNLGSDWLDTLPGPGPYIVLAARTFTLLSYAAVWVGMILAMGSLRRLVRDRRAAGAADHLAVVALGTAICQAVMDGMLRVYDGPHYFNSTWIAYAILAWGTVDAMQRRFAERSVLVRLAMPVYGAAMAVVLGAMIFKVARDGGCREIDYGTSLSEQIGAANRVLSFSPDSPRTIWVPQWARSEWGLRVLKELLPPVGGSDKPTRNLIVRYRDKTPSDAGIVVEDIPL